MDITREHITQIFDQFEANDHLNRIRFYESHTTMIFSLDEKEQYYFSWQYINSLFELGKHESVLAEIDNVIEYVFIYDVDYIPVSTFEDLLFKKASCYFNILEFDQCIEISEQLIGIDPDNKLYQALAMKAHRSSYNLKSATVRLTAILLIFSSAIVSATIWLLSTRGHSQSLLLTFLVVASPCVLALLLIAGAYGISYLRSIRLIRLLVQSKKTYS